MGAEALDARSTTNTGNSVVSGRVALPTLGHSLRNYARGGD